MSNSRQLTRPTSPLVNHWVAQGFYYDKRTGLVKPSAGSSSSSARSTQSGCIQGVSPDESICPDGVKVTPRPVDPFNPAGRRS